MRNRSNSGVRLDYYQRLVNKAILQNQSPTTGLIPATGSTSHAWVRDNVYCIMAVWGLSLAYRKTADLDEDRAKAYELEQAVVKLMRGLLCSMMMQVEKLEKFKYSQAPKDALHAKYCSLTGKTVVGDGEWGHLQIDATSLYLLILSQMTASGLQIVYTLDEVSFVQNLVFYIETAYRTPDYGIWERGDKTNHGLPELNSSSIGMAKAALEAINELDLFGARGGPASIVHVLPDEAQQCQAILHSMLPKESSSKETDAGLIAVISFPAFAVDDVEIIEETREYLVEKLEGNYGFIRFLRDGYKTAREDSHRLHYEPWELQAFEKIECQWPMFFAYFMLDGIFSGCKEQTQRYRNKLENLLLKGEDGLPVIPELYTVPADKVDLEYRNPNSQKRLAIGKCPHIWGESMYILSKLLEEGFISPGELDPLNRRLVTEPKPDVVVQVVILAEDDLIKEKMADHGIHLQTIPEVSPIQVYPARVLSQIYSLLGKNRRLGLTGRPSSEIGLLATSKLYMLQDQILAFIPQFVDQHQFYLPLDMNFLVDHFKNDVDYLADNWRMLGRPTFIFPISGSMLDAYHNPPHTLIATIKKLQSGYIAGTRVHMGMLSDFLSTSCVTKLSFVRDLDDPAEEQVLNVISGMLNKTCPRPRLLSGGKKMAQRKRVTRSKSSVHGIVRRSRSIQIDADQVSEPSSPPPYPKVQETFIPPALHASMKLGTLQDGTSSKSSSPGSPTDENHPFLHLRGVVPNTTGIESPTGSPKSQRKRHFQEGNHYENVNITELIDQLSHVDNLHEQADIVHFLFVAKGPDWDTEVSGKSCTVRELLVELYEKAGHWKQWWLIRHTAGMLKKRVEDLALAATDLLVRQKQLSLGLPPEREKIITCPLPPDELAAIIYDACGEDLSTASLTQEILIYLAMFIRTEPKLFNEMLRLRVGLIIQVMASELARTLKCTGEEASDHLLNLSPFELKTLLHHILSGKEFVISSEIRAMPKNESMEGISGLSKRYYCIENTEVEDECRLSVKSKPMREEATQFAMLSRCPNKMGIPTISLNQPNDDDDEDESMNRQGQWLRRRRLDGALNRVPVGFYPRVWKILSMCHGLSIEGHLLPQSLTREMTPGEFKFALQVEKELNRIPQPEYRQLLVEALMVLTLLAENDWKLNLNQVIQVDRLVHEANSLFVEDQKIPQDALAQCVGAAGICHPLYDSAPSGRFGTMSYLCRALAKIMHLPVGNDENIECVVS